MSSYRSANFRGAARWSAVAGATLLVALATGRPAQAQLNFNLNFNDSAMMSAGLSAGDITNVHNACNYVASQFSR
jgi:hypothetical protein